MLPGDGTDGGEASDLGVDVKAEADGVTAAEIDVETHHAREMHGGDASEYDVSHAPGRGDESSPGETSASVRRRPRVDSVRCRTQSFAARLDAFHNLGADRDAEDARGLGVVHRFHHRQNFGAAGRRAGGGVHVRRDGGVAVLERRGADGVIDQVERRLERRRALDARGTGAQHRRAAVSSRENRRDGAESARRASDMFRGVDVDRDEDAALGGSARGRRASRRGKVSEFEDDAGGGELLSLVRRAHLDAHDARDTRGALARDERG